MKTFTVKLRKNSLKKSMDALKRAVRTGVPEIHKDELFCDSVETMMETISRSKLAAFAAIVEYKPKSIKELAEVLNKDLGNVSRDVKVLALLGLVELRKENEHDPRALCPIAMYDKITFDFTPARAKGA